MQTLAALGAAGWQEPRALLADDFERMYGRRPHKGFTIVMADWPTRRDASSPWELWIYLSTHTHEVDCRCSVSKVHRIGLMCRCRCYLIYEAAILRLYIRRYDALYKVHFSYISSRDRVKCMPPRLYESFLMKLITLSRIHLTIKQFVTYNLRLV